MDFISKMKSYIFGRPLNENEDHNFRSLESPPPPPLAKEFRAPDENSQPFTHFDVYTDPFKMHQYFEEQMNSVLRNFGLQDFGGNFFGIFDNPDVEGGSLFDDRSRIIEIPDQPPSGNLRDHFLKPGYEKAVQHPSEKIDQDIDGRLHVGELDSILGRNQQLLPSQPKPFVHFKGQSISTRTIMRSDGTKETHKTVRDSDGNEETTITQKLGDKEYTVIKKRDKFGKEEVIENLTNMDEKDISIFRPTKEPHEPDRIPMPPNWFPFDRFFK